MNNLKKGWTIWFIGLHCSGKTTITEKLVKILREKNIPLAVLDGDEVRKTLSSDLGYSLEDRNTHMKRVTSLCKIITENGVLCIACVASPTESSRKYARQELKNIITVYVKCPIEICEKRDTKGHYKKARKKERGFENFLGVNLPFEEPKNPDIILNTEIETVDESVNNLINSLKEKGVLDVP